MCNGNKRTIIILLSFAVYIVVSIFVWHYAWDGWGTL